MSAWPSTSSPRRRCDRPLGCQRPGCRWRREPRRPSRRSGLRDRLSVPRSPPPFRSAPSADLMSTRRWSWPKSSTGSLGKLNSGCNPCRMLGSVGERLREAAGRVPSGVLECGAAAGRGELGALGHGLLGLHHRPFALRVRGGWCGGGRLRRADPGASIRGRCAVCRDARRSLSPAAGHLLRQHRAHDCDRRRGGRRACSARTLL